MMADSLSRAILRALQPPGSLWIPEDGKDLDLLYDGMAVNTEEIRTFLQNLAYVRSPQLTTVLSDLEKEFGLLPDSALTEAERRVRLAAAKTANKGDGTSTFLESTLQASGFNVQVHVNNPPVDPAGFLAVQAVAQFNVVTGAVTMFGEPDSLFGGLGGTVIINGRTDDNQSPLPGSGNSEYWPLIFFVGGAATRDPVTGALTAIAPATVKASRRDELVNLIVKYKPLHTWCGLIATYTV